MGSSKSGSLDKFASFSPAAALASGKVKLPETSLIGMMQADAEDDKVMQENNLANQMNFQNQQDEQQQYMQMLQQQMMPGMNQGGQVNSMKFLKQHLPYQDGGHVALRRKMFKMGGDVNTHGVGITSGLSFNQGGAVKPGPDGRDRVHASTGKFIADLLTGGGSFAVRRGKKLYDDIIKARTKSKGPGDVPAGTGIIPKAGPPTAPGPGILGAYTRALKSNPLSTLGATGVTGAALGLPAYANIFQRGRDMNAPNETFGDTLGDFAVETGRAPVTFTAGLPFYGKDILESEDASEAFKALLGEGERYGDFYETLYGSRPPSGTTSPDELDTSNVSQKAGATVEKLRELNELERQERMEEAMQKYADLLSQGDDRDKLAMLGDSLIAGGASLMEGEGYGAAAQAFNQPLSESRRAMEERTRATNQAAAELAISEDMQINSEDRAIVNEMIATGELASADQAKLYLLGSQSGASAKLPTDDEGKIDTEALENAKNIIYSDVTLQTGNLLVAFDSNGKELFTNDPEEAKAHASS